MDRDEKAAETDVFLFSNIIIISFKFRFFLLLQLTFPEIFFTLHDHDMHGKDNPPVIFKFYLNYF